MVFWSSSMRRKFIISILKPSCPCCKKTNCLHLRIKLSLWEIKLTSFEFALENSIQYNSQKGHVIKNWPKYRSSADLCRFLTVTGFWPLPSRIFEGYISPAALSNQASEENKFNEECNKAFATLQNKIKTYLFLIAPCRDKPFRGPLKAFQNDVGQTLSHMDYNARNRVFYYFY